MSIEYLEHLSQACDDLCMGFHFEEGGCWGMALALHETLLGQAVEHRILVRPHGFVHAMVEVGTTLYDYQGSMRPPASTDELVVADDKALIAWAAGAGWSEEEVLADKFQALEVIARAMQIAQEPSSDESPVMGCACGADSSPRAPQ